MAGHFAAFIDAGFLRAAGARALGLKNYETLVDGEGLMKWLRLFRAYEQGDELLRAYWYDGAYDPSHAQYATQRRLFDALDSVPGLELRLGHLVEREPKWHRALERALDRCGVEPGTVSGALPYEGRPCAEGCGHDHHDGSHPSLTVAQL